MSNQLLVVRASDLVVLGVEHTGCAVEPGRLRATDSGATLSVTFPPQSLSESLAPGSTSARLSGPSVLTVPLEPGEVVGLDLAGLISALTSRPLRSGTAVELPFGLVLTPVDDVVARAPGSPVVAPVAEEGEESTALWQLVLADDTGPTPLGARLVVADAPSRTEVELPPAPDPGTRGQLRYSGGSVQATRLRLSALGGSLGSSMVTPEIEWDQQVALGRDQRTRVLRRGVLFPFGHAVSVLTTTERHIGDDGVARLEQSQVMRVVEPVRTYVDDGSLPARELPFHAAEVLGPRELEVTLTGIRSWTPPQGWDAHRDALVAQHRQPLDQATADLAAAWPEPLPRSYDDYLRSAYAAGTDALDVEYRLEQANTALADVLRAIAEAQPGPTDPTTDGGHVDPVTGEWVRDDGPPVTLPPAAADWIPADLYQRKVDCEAAVAGVQAERAACMDVFDDLDDAYAAARAPVDRLELEHRQYVEDLDGEAPTVTSTIHDGVGGPEHPFAVRLAGRRGDVVVTTPLYLLHDVRVPAAGDFPTYRSLDDWQPSAGLGLPDMPIGPTVVDVVRRSGAPLPCDLLELHSISIGSGRLEDGRVRPVLGDFTLAVPELRALLPHLDGVTTGRLASSFVSDGDDAVLVELVGEDELDGAVVTGVVVGFAGHAERGGGLVLPSFTADRISRDFGPVAADALPGAAAEAARAALSSMRLFGLSLADLLAEVDVPPVITQVLDEGLPRGVRMTWDRPLRSSGMFLARGPGETRDTTTLGLLVEQGLDGGRTTCSVSAFSLALPDADAPLVRVDVGGLGFTTVPGRAPDLEVGGLSFELGGDLELLRSLQERAGLGSVTPDVTVSDDGIAAAYHLEIPDAPAAGFTMTGIALTVAVWVPFRQGVPRVDIDFASPERPFELVVPPFGGSGYLGVGIDSGGIGRVAGSLEFGGSVDVDFVVAEAEAHVRAGALVVYDGDGIVVAGFLHIGGSVEVLGLVTVAVDLRVELAYTSDPSPRLSGSATLVIEIDLTLYSDTVELESGEWTFIGGSDPGREDRERTAPRGVTTQDWQDYQEAYA